MALTPQARQTYTRLFGVEPTPHPTDPELYEILQNQIFGEVFATGVLTDVERELLTVTVLATMQTLPQLAAHVRGALSAGATPLQVREAIYQCAPYIGYPKTLNAAATAAEVLASAGVDLPLPEAATVAYEDRAAAGRAIQEPLYGDEVEEVFSALPEPFNRVVPQLLTAGAFGEIETRDGLDVAMRELIPWSRSPPSERPPRCDPMSRVRSGRATAGRRSPRRSCRPCHTSAGLTPCRGWSSWRPTTRTTPRRRTAERPIARARGPLCPPATRRLRARGGRRR